MPTSRKPDGPKVAEKPRAERGRYARRLADGYVVDIERAPTTQKPEKQTPRPTIPTR
jgi:hypothetical protein